MALHTGHVQSWLAVARPKLMAVIHLTQQVWTCRTAAACEGSSHRLPADALPSSSVRRLRSDATSATACALATSPSSSPACARISHCHQSALSILFSCQRVRLPVAAMPNGMCILHGTAPAPKARTTD